MKNLKDNEKLKDQYLLMCRIVEEIGEVLDGSKTMPISSLQIRLDVVKDVADEMVDTLEKYFQ